MNIFKQFLISVSQFDKYSELVKLKAGKVILYEIILFLVTTVVSLMPFIFIFISYGGTEGMLDKFIPDFKIENGTLYAETTVIDQGSTLIIIDGNNVRTDFDLQGVENGVIFDKEKIILHSGIRNEQMTYDELLSALDMDKFEKSDMFNYISELNISLLVFLVFTIAALIFSEVTGIIIMSFLASLLNMFLKKALKYPELIKISVYARTLSAILSAILVLFGISLDFVFIVVLNVAYLFFSIKNYQNNNVNEV